jgi:hypothetical protein
MLSAMRILLLLAGLTLSLTALPQEIYRWVDQDGVTHYSDQPGVPGAERVILVSPNTYGQEPSDLGPYAATRNGDEEEPETGSYTSLTIVQPTPDQTFFGADATVSAAVDLGGTLRSDHTIVYFVDGTRRAADAGGGLTLTGLERGSHFLRAAVLDQNGNPLITSPQITFHLRQPSVNTPQSPQRPPPPKPRPTPPG